MKPKADYTEIDAAILAAMPYAPQFAGLIANPAIKTQAENLAKARGTDRWGRTTPGWRIVDQRLQALRRAGRIRFEHPRGWTVT